MNPFVQSDGFREENFPYLHPMQMTYPPEHYGMYPTMLPYPYSAGMLEDQAWAEPGYPYSYMLPYPYMDTCYNELWGLPEFQRTSPNGNWNGTTKSKKLKKCRANQSDVRLPVTQHQIFSCDLAAPQNSTPRSGLASTANGSSSAEGVKWPSEDILCQAIRESKIMDMDSGKCTLEEQNVGADPNPQFPVIGGKIDPNKSSFMPEYFLPTNHFQAPTGKNSYSLFRTQGCFNPMQYCPETFPVQTVHSTNPANELSQPFPKFPANSGPFNQIYLENAANSDPVHNGPAIFVPNNTYNDEIMAQYIPVENLQTRVGEVSNPENMACDIPYHERSFLHQACKELRSQRSLEGTTVSVEGNTIPKYSCTSRNNVESKQLETSTPSIESSSVPEETSQVHVQMEVVRLENMGAQMITVPGKDLPPYQHSFQDLSNDQHNNNTVFHNGASGIKKTEIYLRNDEILEEANPSFGILNEGLEMDLSGNKDRSLVADHDKETNGDYPVLCSSRDICPITQQMHNSNLRSSFLLQQDNEFGVLFDSSNRNMDHVKIKAGLHDVENGLHYGLKKCCASTYVTNCHNEPIMSTKILPVHLDRVSSNQYGTTDAIQEQQKEDVDKSNRKSRTKSPSKATTMKIESETKETISRTRSYRRRDPDSVGEPKPTRMKRVRGSSKCGNSGSTRSKATHHPKNEKTTNQGNSEMDKELFPSVNPNKLFELSPVKDQRLGEDSFYVSMEEMASLCNTDYLEEASKAVSVLLLSRDDFLPSRNCCEVVSDVGSVVTVPAGTEMRDLELKPDVGVGEYQRVLCEEGNILENACKMSEMFRNEKGQKLLESMDISNEGLISL